MGLTLRVNRRRERSISYTGFSNFRQAIASHLGIKLSEMEGFGGTRSWEHWTDALSILLSHADNDGELSPYECKAIAPRLRDVAGHLPDDAEAEFARELATLMEAAAKSKKPLLFR